jgi:hypothetical protein
MSEQRDITRREAIQRVTVLLGGIALVGGSSLLTGCRRDDAATDSDEPFTTGDIAFLDEVAETILPQTSTPGAKAAGTGAFMALMVTDSYGPDDRKRFRAGMRTLDDEMRKANNVSFMQATPQQRLALLERVDREQYFHSARRRNEARKKRGLTEIPIEVKSAGDEHLTDQRKESAPGSDIGAATAITADTPAHYFRMMKELALLGYFTSEIGATQAQRYVESPGRYDPCVPYKPGEKAWAPHA